MLDASSHSLRLAALALTIASLAFLPSIPAQPAPPQPELARMVAHTPPEVLDGRATFVAAYPKTNMLRLAIALTPRDLGGARAFNERIHDPHSPEFHHFLTIPEYRARFGPTPEAEQAIVDWARSQGLTITAQFPNGGVIDLEAPVATIEKAFQVSINRYQVSEPDGSTRLAFANDRDPSVPASLHGKITFIAGLESILLSRPAIGGKLPVNPDYTPGPTLKMLDHIQADADPTAVAAASKNPAYTRTQPASSQAIHPAAANPNPGYYSPAQVLAPSAYNYQGLTNIGRCCNLANNPGGSPPASSIAVAIPGDVQFADINAFQAAYPYLAFNVSKFAVDGTYGCSYPDANCTEASIDTEWTIATGNSLHNSTDTAQVLVYEGADTKTSTDVDLIVSVLNYAPAKVLSISWGWPETTGIRYSGAENSLDNAFTEMVSEGWSIAAATGDQGAVAGCGNGLDDGFPSVDPNVTAVGGTLLSENSTNGYETGWQGSNTPGACASNGGGSTGGYSTLYGTPSYQTPMGLPYRATPDISLDAAAGENIIVNGSWVFGGGTSIAAPKVAGFFAQANAFLGAFGFTCGFTGNGPCSPMGNANFAIYDAALSSGNPALNLPEHNPFYDITAGCSSNDITVQYGLTAYCAGTGYDLVTGWGSFNALQMAYAIATEYAPYDGSVTATLSGPDITNWTNTDPVVNWSVQETPNPAESDAVGIVGSTVVWDSSPTDTPFVPRTGNLADSYFTGPAMPGVSSGCADLTGASCSLPLPSDPQGCHILYVDGWSNQGTSSGIQTYGPICYDTIAPTVSNSLNPVLPTSRWYNQAVTLTANARDLGNKASGLANIYYSINNASCSTTNTSACRIYRSPQVFAAEGLSVVQTFAQDNAGNFSAPAYSDIQIDLTPPTTTAVLSGSNFGDYYQSPVNVSLNAYDALSGVNTTSISIDSSPVVPYSGAFTVPGAGVHKLTYSSTDVAGNVEGQSTTAFTIQAPVNLQITVKNPNSVPGTLVAGQAAKITATLTLTNPAITTPSLDGYVTYYDNEVFIGTSQVHGGVTSFQIASIKAGSHLFFAVYHPTGPFTPSNSNSVFTSILTPTHTLFTISPTVINYGDTTRFTAQVTGSALFPPTGTISFNQTLTNLPIASVGIVPGTPSQVQVSNLTAGRWVVQARYIGDRFDTASYSAVQTVTVRKISPTVELSGPASPINEGDLATFTATVSSPVSTPTGSVNFVGYGKSLGIVPLVNGVATLQTTIPVGNHSVVANYTGDHNFVATSSTTVSIITNEPTTTTLTTSPNPSVPGQIVFLRASVTGTPRAVNSGTVSFYSGATLIGTSNVVNGQASLTDSVLPNGPSLLTAVYNGAPYLLTSTSTPITQNVYPR